jgi:hypothetical protein
MLTGANITNSIYAVLRPLASTLLIFISATFAQVGQGNAATVQTANCPGANCAITGVLDLVANGAHYDVTFAYGHSQEFNWIPAPLESPGDTPDFSFTQASAIINALIVEFNNISAIYAQGPVAADPINQPDFTQQLFEIAYALGGAGTLNVYGQGSVGTWSFMDNSPTGLGPTSARMYAFPVLLDVSAVPLPAALPLFASGAGLLGFLGWRRKRRVANAPA